jgi:phosphoglycolate phosphatase
MRQPARHVDKIIVARLWYGQCVALCVFDLDHTLIRTPLDLAAMALDMRALIEGARGPLPARPERWRVGELTVWAKAHAADLEPAVWEVALAHERRAMDAATLEPGARDAVAGARGAGFQTAIWTNNARAISVPALERLGLAVLLDLVVTRDDMRALKPDPDGWRVILEHFNAPLGGGTASARTTVATDDAVVVGDSWVDGVAAAAAGVPFVAYRAREEELARWGVTPVARFADLAALPAWLETRRNGSARR